MDPLFAFGSDAADRIWTMISLWTFGSARMLSATMVFSAFAWGHINSGVIRSGLAMTIALPVVVPLFSAPQAAEAAIGSSYWILLSKELLLGFVLGLAASLPLEAVGVAGNLIEGVRGGGQLPGPLGDNTTYGHLFMVITLWVFAALGGFWYFAAMIYASYGLWPLTAGLPVITDAAPSALMLLISRFLMLAATLAGPPIAILLSVDIVMLIANRLGRRMNVLDLSLSLKSLALLALMPLYVFVVVRMVSGELPSVFDLSVLASVFKN